MQVDREPNLFHFQIVQWQLHTFRVWEMEDLSMQEILKQPLVALIVAIITCMLLAMVLLFKVLI